MHWSQGLIACSKAGKSSWMEGLRNTTKYLSSSDFTCFRLGENCSVTLWKTYLWPTWSVHVSLAFKQCCVPELRAAYLTQVISTWQSLLTGLRHSVSSGYKNSPQHVCSISHLSWWILYFFILKVSAGCKKVAPSKRAKVKSTAHPEREQSANSLKQQSRMRKKNLMRMMIATLMIPAC